MKPTMKAGIVLGVLVGIWTLVMGVTGWYKDPALVSVFYVVIVIEIGVLIWGLKKTAPESTYGKQVWNGTLISIIGSVIIFCVSYLFTTVLYPNYFTDLQAIQEKMLANEGKSSEEIAKVLEAGRTMATPLINALSGVIGTVVTGFVGSLIIGAFFKKKR
jgi:hypothetical protein